MERSRWSRVTYSDFLLSADHASNGSVPAVSVLAWLLRHLHRASQLGMVHVRTHERG